MIIWSVKNEKLWAVQLDLLAELDRVCTKHNLLWYADSGTRLGAVRYRSPGGSRPADDHGEGEQGSVHGRVGIKMNLFLVT